MDRRWDSSNDLSSAGVDREREFLNGQCIKAQLLLRNLEKRLYQITTNGSPGPVWLTRAVIDRSLHLSVERMADVISSIMSVNKELDILCAHNLSQYYALHYLDKYIPKTNVKEAQVQTGGVDEVDEADDGGPNGRPVFNETYC